VAKHAEVKMTYLFHHDPSHDDEKMDAIAEEAQREWTAVRPAVEGETVSL